MEPTDELRLLIVQPDDDRFTLTRALLRDAFGPSLIVDRAVDAGDGLGRALRGGYDVLLLDDRIGPPGPAEWIRQLGDQVEVALPIVVLTTGDTPDDDRDILLAGALECLVISDLTPALLRRSVRYALERRHREQGSDRPTASDTATGVGSREDFMRRIESAIADATRSREQLAVALLDVDGFREIGETHGPSFTADVLREVARRLQGQIRETDLLARLGPDEFVVLARHLRHADDVNRLGEKLIDALAEPLEVQGIDLCVGISAGVSIFPHDGGTAEILLANADAALYSARTGQRGPLRLFDDERDRELRTRAGLRDDLIEALRTGDLTTQLQPIVTATGRPAGAEAVPRWHHSTRGWVAPDRFVPVAESCGSIRAIAAQLLENSCKVAAALERVGVRTPLAIGLFADQLRGPEITGQIEQALDRWQLPAGRLELWVSAHVVSRTAATAYPILDRLGEMGVGLAIDGLGTLGSSLDPLRFLPARKVKIDLDRVPIDLARGLVAMARAMKREVVIGGVATMDHWRAAQETGCDLIQGDYISGALPPRDFRRWMEEHAVAGTASRA